MKLKCGIELITPLYNNVIVFDTKRKLYYNFNETGQLFLRKILSGNDINTIVQEISSETNISIQHIQESLKKFKNQLVEKDLIEE